MLNQAPALVWVLVAIAAAAYRRARYVFRHVTSSPASRDITQPAEDLSWRTPQQLLINLAILIALGGFAVFIFTPTARQLAEAPIFWPLIMAAFGAWTCGTVVKGFLTGSIRPLIRGEIGPFARSVHPKRFWASMAWNALFGGLLLWIGFLGVKDSVWRPYEDLCFDREDIYSGEQELAACNYLIAKRGTDQDVIAARGTAYFKIGDYEHARIDYSEALRLDPLDSSSIYNLGLIAERLGNFELALAQYTGASRVDPSNDDAFFRHGLLLFDDGKYDEAIADFTRAHNLKRRDPWPLANRGLAFAWKNDKASAERDFRTVRSLDPSNPVMLRGEALLSAREGDPDRAIAKLTASLKSDPGNKFALRLRAKLYRELGRLEDAQADRDELLRLDDVSTDPDP